MQICIRNFFLPEVPQSKPEQGGWCWHSRMIETLLLIIIQPCKQGPDVIESLWTNSHINMTPDWQFGRENRLSWQVGTLFITHAHIENCQVAIIKFSLSNESKRPENLKSRNYKRCACLQAVKHFPWLHQHLCFHPPQIQQRIQLH